MPEIPPVEYSQIGEGGKTTIPFAVWEELALSEGGYLQWMIKDGSINIDRCPDEVFPIRKEMYEKIHTLALSEGKTTSELLEKIVDDYIEEKQLKK